MKENGNGVFFSIWKVESILNQHSERNLYLILTCTKYSTGSSLRISETFKDGKRIRSRGTVLLLERSITDKKVDPGS